jgi:short chain dehydrogenase
MTFTDTKTWRVTGAGRGMGVDLARAALAAGHNVVATGRKLDTVRSAVGEHEQLLVARLDITDAQSAERAVAVAVARFGRIDVLVNNAGNFLGGFFEELSPRQVRSQIETNRFGPMTVTRAVLPLMRKQRSGLVISISPQPGQQPIRLDLRGVEVRAGGLDRGPGRRGRALRDRHDDRRAGVLPHRAAAAESTTFGELSIDDYAERTAETIPAWRAMNGRQAGDPAKLARALVELAGSDEPPPRWLAGEDAVEAVEQKARLLLAQVDAHRELSISLAHDDARVAA